MTGFNLPPGVEVHHIPGNRPEDLAEEKFLDTVEKMLEESIGEQRAAHFFDYVTKGDWEEVLYEYVTIAAGLSAAKANMEWQMQMEVGQNDETSDS